MADYYSIAEVSRLTGLASHTLRFYEQQFPFLLDIERTKGGHRVYRSQHLDSLNSIVRLLKDEKVSIKKAREILGESVDKKTEKASYKISAEETDTSGDIEKLLLMVIEKLDKICRNNENRDRMIDSIIRNQPFEQRDELLDQISRCRRETRETMKLCQLVMQRHSHSGVELNEH